MGWAIRGDWISDAVDSNWTVTPVNETQTLGRKRQGLVPRFQRANRYRAIFPAFCISTATPSERQKTKKADPEGPAFHFISVVRAAEHTISRAAVACLPHILCTDRDA